MKNISILWVDDEIELLKPHVLYLQERGFNVYTVTNGDDAIKRVSEQRPDLIFLDENMPGLSGLETLDAIKGITPATPVIMITKSEEEDIMDQAIGAKIADYLIKPVNPNQILLSIKKNLDTKRLVTLKTTANYQAEFSRISMLINSASSFDDWVDIYTKLVYWEIELGRTNNEGMEEVLSMQKVEANQGFSRFINSNYFSWFDGTEKNIPLLSPNVFKNSVFPLLDKGEKVFVIVIDNLRYDQWKTIEPSISEFFNVDKEQVYCSILPTATQYSRNAMFAGLMPLEIERMFPKLWFNDDEDEGKNLFEPDLLQKQFSRAGKNYKFTYEKVLNSKAGKKLYDNFSNLLNYELSVLVYNFVDMLSHARTEMEVLRELASDEPAYRSLTNSWFTHSHLLDVMKELSNQKVKVIITTDHGTIRVTNPVKVIGDRKTSTNLRYKTGKNLNYNPKDVFEVKQPGKVHLPSINVTSSYIFAYNTDFLVYPNNLNYYANYYRNTFQHGGISMEEMLIPLVLLSPK